MCKTRFHDVIDSTACLHHDDILRKNTKTWPNDYDLVPYLFNLISWIQLCDKKNLAFVDCFDKVLLYSS